MNKLMGKRSRYRDLPWWHQVLDAFLLMGVIMGIVLTVAGFLQHPQGEFARFLYGFDLFLVGVLTVDMSRHLLESRNFFHFARHYWLDMIILMLMLLSFSSLVYLGFGRLSWLLREEKVFGSASKFLSLSFLRRSLR